MARLPARPLRSGFEKWFQQPVLRSAPAGPPSRQWLARQPKFSTEPMGLGAVAGLPTQGPAVQEVAPLPPSREQEPLPGAPAAERSGRLQLSTLRPDAGIGQLGESPEEMNARLAREQAAEGLLTWPGLAKAVGLGQMTLPEAVKFQASESARADKAAEASFQSEKTETQERLKMESDFRELDALLKDKGYGEREAFLEASRAANAGKAPEIITRLRKERGERKAAEAKTAATQAKATRRDELAQLLPGSIGRGAGVGQPQHVLEFQRGARTYAGAHTAGRAAQRLPQRAAAYATLRRLGEAPKGLSTDDEAEYNRAKAIVGGSAFVRRGEETAAEMIRRLMDEAAPQ